MKALLAVVLAFVGVSVLAQAPAPAAKEEQRPATAPGPRLNLRLDDAARYSREAPREEIAKDKEAPGGLPTLGGNASTEKHGTPKWGGSGPSPYPKDETPLR